MTQRSTSPIEGEPPKWLQLHDEAEQMYIQGHDDQTRAQQIVWETLQWYLLTDLEAEKRMDTGTPSGSIRLSTIQLALTVGVNLNQLFQLDPRAPEGVRLHRPEFPPPPEDIPLLVKQYLLTTLTDLHNFDFYQGDGLCVALLSSLGAGHTTLDWKFFDSIYTFIVPDSFIQPPELRQAMGQLYVATLAMCGPRPEPTVE